MLLLCVLALTIGAFLGFEVWALLTGHITITDYARILQVRKPFALLGGVAVLFLAFGILLGHFWA